MWRLYKNKQNKFEIAFVHENGRYAVGSKQGYENKKDVLHELRQLNANYFQDETRQTTSTYLFSPNLGKWVKTLYKTVIKPYSKRYILKKKKAVKKK